MYIYQTKINKHKNSNGSYSFFDFVKKMSYYFRYNEQINIIYNYKYIFGVPTFLYVYLYYTACFLEFLFVCSSLKIIYQLFQCIQLQLVYLVVILMPLPEARETTCL
jgi:hypothetical protein